MDFWIASYPRSGNTFLRIVLRNRYAVMSLPERPRAEPVPKYMGGGDKILHPLYSGPDAPVVAARGLKTHHLPPDADRPAVYTVRDGRDVVTSYAHYSLAVEHRIPPETITPELVRQTISDVIRETRSPYGTWGQNVLAWLARPSTVLVRFEELIADPGGVCDRIVAGLGLDIPKVSDFVPTFRELNAFMPNLFRRGATGGWAEAFTPDLEALFWKHNANAMARAGYATDRRAAAA